MIRKAIHRLISWAMTDTDREGRIYAPTVAAYATNKLASSSSEGMSSTGIKFEVYRANGGHIIETRRYDRRKDENLYEMYIITEDKNMGEELGRIITMESLKIH